MPEHFVPVWIQLVGHPAESSGGGGQRPGMSFEELFAAMRWGTPFVRDAAVVEDLATRRPGATSYSMRPKSVAASQ